MQLWKGPAELTGRTVMRDGVWLDDVIACSQLNGLHVDALDPACCRYLNDPTTWQ